MAPDESAAAVGSSMKSTTRYAGIVVAAFADPHTVVHGHGDTVEGGTRPVADTIFQIGSVTKVFTALVLADAVVREELFLDTPLADLLPEAGASEATARITLGHLASHTSGLPRLPRGLLRQALGHRLDPYREFGTEDLCAALATARVRREPGARSRYSNFGAVLLGEALSRHTGLPCGQMIERKVTGPLHLPDTVAHLRPDQQQRKAVGHDRRHRPVPDWDMGAMPGAGALYSTAGDLLLFLRAHVEPAATPLRDALELVQQPRARANRRVRAGLGWQIVPVRGTPHTALWHNGGTGGFCSHVSVLPQQNAGVVVLANTARSVDPIGLRTLRALARSAGAPPPEALRTPLVRGSGTPRKSGSPPRRSLRD